MDHSLLLSFIIFTPALLAVLLLFIPASALNWVKPLTLVQTLLSLALSLVLYQSFDSSLASAQFTQIIPWLPNWGINYHVVVDGLSLPLVMLTAFISPVALLGTWSTKVEKNVKLFYGFVMLLQTGMYGTFLAADLFLFYFFWEAVLIPMFFLIGVWGGENRIYASVKFFLYTLVGSLLMLVAIFYLLYSSKTSGSLTASMIELVNLSHAFDGSSLGSALSSPQSLLFFAFTLAFVIKIPMVPFHTWLPDAHVQAPTIGSVFLAAVLLKLGTYGLMRISLPFFPQAAFYFSQTFVILGVIGIVYGAFCALGQSDFKKLVAYSSVSHMGYILVGIFSFQKLAMAGSLYQMINHGISAGGLFLIVGFLYERMHTRKLMDFGGLAKTMPLIAICFMLMTLSSVALPGTNGFVGEFTILLGSFQAWPYLTLLAGTGVIFGAVYALRAYQIVMLGSPRKDHHGHESQDLRYTELIAMLVLVFFIFAIGFFPRSFFFKSDAYLENYHQTLIEKVGTL
jgi:NADH-quinone oxidoreductase subunit M